jgi:hypothetical protein
LIDWVVAEGIPDEFTFDSYFTNAPILNHINAAGRAYVGDLQANRIVTVDGCDLLLSDEVSGQKFLNKG